MTLPRRPLLALAAALVLPLALAAGWATYRNPRLGLELEHPAGWRPRLEGSTVAFADPASNDASPFEVRVERGTSLNAWVSAQRKERVSATGASLVQSVGDTTLTGRPAKRLVVFAFDRSLAVEGVLANGRLYVVSYDASNPNDPRFAEHSATYGRMRSSLRFR